MAAAPMIKIDGLRFAAVFIAALTPRSRCCRHKASAARIPMTAAVNRDLSGAKFDDRYHFTNCEAEGTPVNPPIAWSKCRPLPPLTVIDSPTSIPKKSALPVYFTSAAGAYTAA